MLGSVSHYALNHAGVPVLIIHAVEARTDEKGAEAAPASTEIDAAD